VPGAAGVLYPIFGLLLLPILGQRHRMRLRLRRASIA
jgi:hypothetical protein